MSEASLITARELGVVAGCAMRTAQAWLTSLKPIVRLGRGGVPQYRIGEVIRALAERQGEFQARYSGEAGSKRAKSAEYRARALAELRARESATANEQPTLGAARRAMHGSRGKRSGARQRTIRRNISRDCRSRGASGLRSKWKSFLHFAGCL